MISNQLIENETLEYKRELPSSSKLAREIIALANTKGGKLVIGYDEKQQCAIGIKPDQKTEEKIANIIHDLCFPYISYYISYETIQNATVLVINIDEGSSKPYHIKGTKIFETAFVRIGSTTRLASQEQLASLVREGKNISFDSETISSNIKLDNPLIQNYLQKRQSKLNAPIQKLTSSLLKDLFLTKNNKPTIAGALLFMQSPQSVIELNSAYIKAARFKGNQKGLFLDQKNITGNLSDQIDNAISFVLRHIDLTGIVSGKKRKDIYEYPVEIIREMITNAVTHRDYSVMGSTILLSVFDDRIEITSPGGLPRDITEENIIDRQYSRNPIIGKCLFEMGYFDAWGQGIDKIVLWSKQNNLPEPKFINQHNQFTLIVFGQKSLSKKQKTNQPTLTLLEENVFNHIQTNKQITNRECQKLFSLTKTQAQVILKKLENKNIIQRQGKGRSTYYIQK